MSSPRRAAAIAEALGFINDANLGGVAGGEEIRLLVETYFTDPTVESDDEGDDESNLELDLEGDDGENGGKDDGGGEDEGEEPAVEPVVPMDVSDDEDEDQDPVVVGPVLPDGGGDLPLEQQRLVNAHQHRQEADEVARAERFICACQYYNGGPCSERYTADYLAECRDDMNNMTSGMLRCLTNTSTIVQSTKKLKTARKITRVNFLVEGQQVCKTTFCYMYGFSEKKLRNLQNWYKKHGMTPRVKRAGGRQNIQQRLLTYEDISRVLTFINNFAEDHAISLPGRVPGFRRGDLKLLPCSTTKQQCFDLYKKAMEGTGHRAVGISSFRALWNRLCPNIVRCKPATDLCWVCQLNHNILVRAANLPEEEKEARCRAQLDHLKHVDEERVYYREAVRTAKEAINEDIKLGGGRSDQAHYSFDFAQQVHYPANPRQPGPIYFLTPRKCGLFGISCEAVRQQVNYLIDEGVSSGKGSNSVISYLHHFFSKYGLKERQVDLHCDNCAGQNKNRFMLWYLCWRTLHGHHKSVSLHFMVPGHTKFAPDACFGLIKKKFSVSEVNCLDDIKQVVTGSSKVNLAQVVGTENQAMEVPTYNWQDFLSPYFRPLEGIKNLHHFRFSIDHPGVVFYRHRISDPEQQYQLLKNPSTVPPKMIHSDYILPPPGLTRQRQWYLYEKIREFCMTDATKDITCPRPIGPRDA